VVDTGVRHAILHGLLAIAFVEALLRTWRVGRAASRLRFWTLALACPLVATPLLLVAFPFRAGDLFVARWALFASPGWNAVRLAGVGADTIAFAILMAAGLALFLRDAGPFVVGALRERRDASWTPAGAPAGLVDLVADLARQFAIAPPALAVVAVDARVFYVRGLLHHRLVISQAVLDDLDTRRLRAAVAHELAHAARHDPLAGWLLMAARLAMCWNPAVQLLARAIVQQMERRADEAAAIVTSAADVTAALQRLARPVTAGRQPGGPVRSLRTLTEHLDGAHIHARSVALLEPGITEPARGWQLALAGAGLAVLSFFVV